LVSRVVASSSTLVSSHAAVSRHAPQCRLLFPPFWWLLCVPCSGSQGLSSSPLCMQNHNCKGSDIQRWASSPMGLCHLCTQGVWDLTIILMLYRMHNCLTSPLRPATLGMCAVSALMCIVLTMELRNKSNFVIFLKHTFMLRTMSLLS